MTESLTHYEHFIRQEMLSHPVLFMHPEALQVAIIGAHTDNLLQEMAKHPTIETLWQITPTQPQNSLNDNRVQIVISDADATPLALPAESLDVIILADTNTPLTDAHYTHYLQALKNDGILVQKAPSAFHLPALSQLYHQMQNLGFRETQIYHFPQTSGWSAAMMSIKHSLFKRVREKDIFNKSFTTHYYNYDIHKAAFVMPEFMREELLPE